MPKRFLTSMCFPQEKTDTAGVQSGESDRRKLWMNPKESARVGTPEAEAVRWSRVFCLFSTHACQQSQDRRGTKAKLVSYSKQVLPKFIDEQPNLSNSPLLSALIKDETRTLPVDVALTVSPAKVSLARWF